MKVKIRRETKIIETPRVVQASSIFDVPVGEKSVVDWELDVPIDQKDWQIGLIVGPSGAGKTTAAREIFGDSIVEGYDWPSDKCILDGFPEDMPVKEVTKLLSSVGFGTVPNWLRPFHVLSNGEQFRTTVARAIAECEDGGSICIDEFTSVVDRKVAKVASHCVQKAIRKSRRKMIAVSCHYDILEWLQPDWVLEPHTGEFEWRFPSRRPDITLEVRTASKEIWQVFSKYHYLSHKLHPAAKCITAFVEGRAVAFSAARLFPHPSAKNIMQEHRTVVLPDWQGLGIAEVLSEWLGQYLWERGWRYNSVVAHPAMIHMRAKSKRWKLVKGTMNKDGRMSGSTSKAKQRRHILKFSMQRTARSFEYVGRPDGPKRPRRTKPLEIWKQA